MPKTTNINFWRGYRCDFYSVPAGEKIPISYTDRDMRHLDVTAMNVNDAIKQLEKQLERESEQLVSLIAVYPPGHEARLHRERE